MSDFLHVGCVCGQRTFQIGPADNGLWLAVCCACGNLFELRPDATYTLLKVGDDLLAGKDGK